MATSRVVNYPPYRINGEEFKGISSYFYVQRLASGHGSPLGMKGVWLAIAHYASQVRVGLAHLPEQCEKLYPWFPHDVFLERGIFSSLER